MTAYNHTETPVAGVVVLYNPGPDILDNIKTYANSVERLFVVDNSELANAALASALQEVTSHITYIPLKQNRGIAKALNVAATKATENGYKWLLTMDQDSQASECMVAKLLEASYRYPKGQVGIIAPKYLLDASMASLQKDVEEVMSTITSGSLLNLEAYQQVGPFREDYFIDYVDHDYCLRLQLYNYKVLVDNSVVIHHQLGDLKRYNLLGTTLTSSNHNYVRRYYITRNRLALLNEYKKHFPAYYKSEKNNNFKELVKLILFEDDKLRKLKSVIRGYLDFKRNKFGKYNP